MTAQPLEYPSPPWVQLYAPTPTEEERRVLTAVNASASPEESWRNALTAHRLLIIMEVKKRLGAEPEANITETLILQTIDAVWKSYFPILHRATGPMVAEAYITAFRKAGAGDVPIKLIYALAEEHVRRTGDYFNGTSSDSLIQGFNTYVNRQVPKKAALARVIDAYGLTPRQMSGMTSSKAFETQVKSSLPTTIRQKLKRYIGKSIADRLGIFVRQESHNLNEQAQQVAWMWMVDHGKLPKTTEKMWVTAKDERVCALCGPLHRRKIPIRDQFVLEDGQKLYVPGAHVNCRCKVRLLVPLAVDVSKADDDFDPREHPRDRRGRFVDAPEVAEAPSRDLEAMVRAAREEAERKRREAIEAAQPRIIATPAPPSIQATPGITATPSIKATPTLRADTPRLAADAARTFQAARTLGLTAPSPAALRAGTVAYIQQAREATLPKPTQRTEIRESIRFIDRNGEPLEVYTVPRTYNQFFNPSYDRVMLTSQDELHPLDDAINSGHIARELMEAYNENIYAAQIGILEEAESNGNGHIEEGVDGRIQGSMMIKYFGTNPNLEGAWAVLDESEVLEVVNAYALRHGTNYHNEVIDLEWQSAEGDDLGVTQEYLADLAEAEEFNLSDDMFEVPVFILDEGHEEGFDMDPGSKYGEETWLAPGNYEVIGEQKDRGGTFGLPMVPIRVLRIAPEVRSRIVDMPDSQWPPAD